MNAAQARLNQIAPALSAAGRAVKNDMRRFGCDLLACVLSLAVLPAAADEPWTALASRPVRGVAVCAGVQGKAGPAQAVTAVLRDERVNDAVTSVSVTFRNPATEPVTAKFVVEAVPDFTAERYLIPGILYNGNPYGSDRVPKGLTYKGEPWIFAYDRTTLPSCTVAEDGSHVFALMASDRDAASLESACSLVKRADGRLAHRIWYPVTEAPVSYTNKKIFTPRYDTWHTLAPGGSFTVTCHLVAGRPRWRNFGFGTVFRAAWPLYDHTVPRVMSDEELWTNGMAFINAFRTIDRDGSAGVGGGLQDASHALGNFQKKPEIPPDLTLAAIDADRSKNFFLGEFPEPGRLRIGGCTGIGFTGQCFMSARMMIADGFRRGDPASVRFGLAILDNWTEHHQLPNGLLSRIHNVQTNLPPWKRQTDGCHQGWGIVELVRTAELLKAKGFAHERYLAAAERCARFFLERWDPTFGFGASWELDGRAGARGGDVGGFVLFGIAKLWEMTRDPVYRAAAERGLDFYFTRDVDRYMCGGGAIDCQSVDKESVYPFLETALLMHETTGDAKALERAEKAAAYFASWVYSFNAIYPPEAEFSQIGYHTCGGTVVGVEHQCLDPYGGVVVAPLVKLSVRTGNALWREVAHAIWLNSLQGVATPARQVWHGLRRPVGAQNEAFCQTRWTKYRTDPNKRGNYNDFLGVWMLDFKMASLLELRRLGLVP